MLNPPTETSPAEGGMKPVIMRIVVDLPAPLGPRNPSTSPFSTVNETPLTAVIAPKDFLRLRTLITLKVFFYGKLANVQVPERRFLAVNSTRNSGHGEKPERS